MRYRQLTPEERYMISALRKQGCNQRQIAKNLGRHPSTISREIRRNLYDNRYRPSRAQANTNGRRSRSRRNSQFGQDDWRLIESFLRREWSPEQISGFLKQVHIVSISHETIYRHIRIDRRRGGGLWTHLRHHAKRRRKRYRGADSRGRLQGKRMISARPKVVESRRSFGHWEIDTVMGRFDTKPCIVTVVERKTGYLIIGAMPDRTVESTNRRLRKLMNATGNVFETITADNGTEFHGYREIENQTGVPFYFAQPYHSWERGSNENANGLIRQYLPKGESMAGLTQRQCNAIANKINNRPRKRYGYKTPAELFLSA